MAYLHIPMNILLNLVVQYTVGLPWWLSGKEFASQCKRCESGIHGRRTWQLAPVFLPGKSHGQRGLAGHSSWGHKRVRHDLAAKQHITQYIVIFIF